MMATALPTFHDTISAPQLLLALLVVAATISAAFGKLLWLRRRPSPPLPPGPRNWPVVGALFSLSGAAPPHVAFTRLAQRHGPVVHLRLGTTPALLVSSARYAQQVLREQDAQFASRPYTTAGNEFQFAGTVLTPHGPDWRRKRRLLNAHLFSHPDVVRTFHRVLDEEVGECLREVHAAAVQDPERAAPVVCDVHRLLLTLSTNVICRVSLGKRYLGPKADLSRQTELLKAAVADGNRLFAKPCVGDVIPALRRWDIGGVAAAYRALHAVQDRWMDAVLADRGARRRPDENRDFLDALLGLQEKGELSELSVRYMMYEIQTAGSETASTSIHWAFSELLPAPELMQRAQEELDRAVGRARLATEADLPALPFLRAVVKETWRLHPPLPLGVPHHNEEEATLAGEFRVPAKSTVLINSYAIGRDPALWGHDGVDEFRPDRFLLGAGGRHSHVDGLGSDFELLPFSAGRRKCPGMHLGYNTVHLALAALLHAFDWTVPRGTAPQDVDMTESSGLVLTRAVPCVALPTACRLDPSIYAL